MEVPPLQVLGRDVVLRSAGMLPALHPGCRSAHVVALRLTTRLPLPWAVGFLPYRGDRVAKFFFVIMLPLPEQLQSGHEGESLWLTPGSVSFLQ